jgi:5-formyltetrahydrofolate cyclo-ligase
MDTGKPGLRKALHENLRTTQTEERAAWSAKVRDYLLSSEAWQSARTVMLFAALRYEPDLVPLLNPALGKRLLFPALEEDFIIAREVRSAEDLVKSAGGIREPSGDRCPVVPSEEIQFILVPGLAFDAGGGRLGRGRGHYDRFLARLPDTALRCGVCFDCQMLESLPSEAHDIPMAALLTESGWKGVSPCRFPPSGP